MIVLLALSQALAVEPGVLAWRHSEGQTQRYLVSAEVSTRASRDGRTLIERRERYEYVVTETVIEVGGGLATRRWSLDDLRGLYVDAAAGHDFAFSAEHGPSEGLATDVSSAALGLVGRAETYQLDATGAARSSPTEGALDLFGTGSTALWDLPLPRRAVGEGSTWEFEVSGATTRFTAGAIVGVADRTCRELVWARSREVDGGTTTEEGLVCFSEAEGRPVWARSTSVGLVEPLPGLSTVATVALAVLALGGDQVPWTIEPAVSPLPVLHARTLGQERWMAPGRIDGLVQVGDGLAAAARGRVVLWDEHGEPVWTASGLPGEVAGLAPTEDALVVATRRERLRSPLLEAWRRSSGAPLWVADLPVDPTAITGQGGTVFVGGEDGGVGVYAAQGGLWPRQPALPGAVEAVASGRGWKAALGQGRIAVHRGTHWDLLPLRSVTAVASLGDQLLVASGRSVEMRDPTGDLVEVVGGIGDAADWVEIHHVAGAGDVVAALDSEGSLHTWQRRRKGWRPARRVAEAGVGPLVVGEDGMAWWVDWLGWHLRSTHTVDPRAAAEPLSLLTGMAAAPHQATVATADVSGRVRTWDLDSGEQAQEQSLPLGWDGAVSLAWSPAWGLAFGGRSGGGLVGVGPAWGGVQDLAASGERVFALGRAEVTAWEQADGAWTVAWSAAGESCAVEASGPVVATQHGGQVQIRSALTGEVGTSLEGAARYACGLSLSASGQRVAAIGEPDHRALVWDAVSGAVVLGVALPSDEAEDRFVSVALSPDGRWLAGAFDGAVYLWSVDAPARGPGGTPQPTARLEAGGLVAQALQFSSDGRWLIALPHAGLAARTWDLTELPGR